MLPTFITRLLLIVIAMTAVTFSRASENSGLAAVRTIEDLDKLAVFNFAIMSDNHGDSPKSDTGFARMVQWIRGSNGQFVIGVGDHVSPGMVKNFLSFVKEDPWWHNNFYPNVADGENASYGRGGWDWGAGSKMFDEMGLFSRKHVTIRPNRAEYYAKIRVKDYTVHLIQLTYPDEPDDPDRAFRPDSRLYLVQTIQQIEKGPKDIIIACAHSHWGSWIGFLSPEQRKIVMEKADLIFSATTHFFMRLPAEGYGEAAALCINTGSVTRPRLFSPPGYVQVHVLENPPRLVLQYVHLDREERELEHGRYAWIKYIGGKIQPAVFSASKQPSVPPSSPTVPTESGSEKSLPES